MAEKTFILPYPADKIQTSSKASFQITRTGLQVIKGNVYNIDTPTYDTPIATSALGTPVYDDITFPAASYVNLFGDTISFDEVSLVDVLITVNRTKNVVKTAIQGRDGTIKEYIGAGDYIISVTGKIVSDTNTFPDLDLQNLIAIMDANASLEIVCTFLNEGFGIGYVVVDSHSVSQVQGSRDTLEFTFQCSSDVSIDIEELIID